MTNRVAVTGIGIISPVGPDRDTTWDAIKAGASGIAAITHFDATGFEPTFAGEVNDFDPLDYVDRKAERRMDRFIQFAVGAAHQAIEHAGLTIDDSNADEIGAIFGSGIGGLATISEQIGILNERGPKRVSPFTIPMLINDMASGQVSILFGARGPNFCTTSACSSGSDAIGAAFELIRRGEAKAMLAGGCEAPITPIGIATFNAARTLSRRNDSPETASRPFDATRDGFVMGEGAACLILEDWTFAENRGAPIIAELLAYAATADAHHMTAPDPEGRGAARAMTLAIQRAGLSAGQIDYINAHGTATEMNDRIETGAIKTVFGEAARKLAVSSTKSMTGHLLGAAGAVEAALTVLAVENDLLPPTINYHHPDPECDLDYVPNQVRQATVKLALSNSFGFGGHNSCLIFGKPTA